MFIEIQNIKTHIADSSQDLAKAASRKAENLICKTIVEKGTANIILATGASQIEMLSHLVKTEKVDWSKVRMFHLDEYLKERFFQQVKNLAKAYFINPDEEVTQLNNIITKHPIDVAMIGIGENGHLAFNDPPADFDTEVPYIHVELDEACRRQQMGEGWFSSLDEVPKRAISMSIQQILKSENLVVTVPDQRKAKAVQEALMGELSNQCPASILRKHENCFLFLDKDSSSLLETA